MAKNFITKLVKEENFKSLQPGGRTLQDLDVHVSDTQLQMAMLLTELQIRCVKNDINRLYLRYFFNISYV